MEPGLDDGRVARLREQIQDLRGEPIRATDEVTRPIPTAVEPAVERLREPVPAPAPVAAAPEVRAAASAGAPRVTRGAAAIASVSATSTNVTFWELLGSTREDRFGIVLIGLGAIAVLYALLSQ